MPEYVSCNDCGRMFEPTCILKHEATCDGEGTYKDMESVPFSETEYCEREEHMLNSNIGERKHETRNLGNDATFPKPKGYQHDNQDGFLEVRRESSSGCKGNDATFPKPKGYQNDQYSSIEIRHDSSSGGTGNESPFPKNQGVRNQNQFDPTFHGSNAGSVESVESDEGMYYSVSPYYYPGRKAGVPCDICGRLYGTASFELHRRQCVAKRNKEMKDREANYKHQNRKIREMPGVTCYICNRRYGHAGITYHESQCIEKWHRENDALPKHLRRPAPVKPDINSLYSPESTDAGTISASGVYSSSDYDEAAYEVYQQQLIECQYCSRRFRPDRLPVHQRSCRSGKATRRPNATPDD